MIEFSEIKGILLGKSLALEGLNLEVQEIEEGDLSIEIRVNKAFSISELYLSFDLKEVPEFYRNSSYQWKRVIDSEKVILSSYAAKVLKWKDGSKIIASNNIGAWEIIPKERKLRWYLVHPDLTPTFTYDERDRKVWHKEYKIDSSFSCSLKVFQTVGEIEEWSRTPIGFVPTVCFTDHCDFDSPVLLLKQREIFAQTGIKTTKGIFLYDQSDWPFDAALEQEGILDEIEKWQVDGHEMAYHALSKSEGQESKEHFKNYHSPKDLNPIQVYIDHGFLSYNFTRQAPEDLGEWYQHQSQKSISYIWNYVDVFEGTAVSNNQLSRYDSSIAAIQAASQIHEEQGLYEERSRLVKARLSFGTSEDLDFAVKHLNSSIQRFKKDKLGSLPSLAKSGLQALISGLNPEVIKTNLWQKELPFHFNRFTPLIFKSPNQTGTEIYAFQTASVKNYETTLGDYALDKLEKESGVLIAHTYFGYSSGNHAGRLFLDSSGKVNEKALATFKELGKRIGANKFWNPSLSEMADFYKKMEKISYEKRAGKVILKDAPGKTRSID